MNNVTLISSRLVAAAFTLALATVAHATTITSLVYSAGGCVTTVPNDGCAPIGVTALGSTKNPS